MSRRRREKNSTNTVQKLRYTFQYVPKSDALKASRKKQYNRSNVSHRIQVHASTCSRFYNYVLDVVIDRANQLIMRLEIRSGYLSLFMRQEI